MLGKEVTFAVNICVEHNLGDGLPDAIDIEIGK